MNLYPDKSSLLCDVDGWVLDYITEGLKNSWKKIALNCTGYNGVQIYSQSDIKIFEQKSNPAKAFCENLIQRNISIEYLEYLFTKCDLPHLLTYIRKPELMEISLKDPSDEVISIDEGKSLMLKIETKGFPPPSYKWYRGSNLQHVIHNTNTFKIDKFSCDLEDVYLCHLTQTINGIEHELWSSFDVITKDSSPIITLHPNDLKLTVGDQILLKCEAVGYPIPSYTWIKNNEIISNIQILNLQNVDHSDSGIYKCLVENDLGSIVSNESIVQVTGKKFSSKIPKIIEQPLLHEDGKSVRSFGQKIHLNCLVYCSVDVHFKWVINGVPLLEENGSNFRILNAKCQENHDSTLNYTVSKYDPEIIKIVCHISSEGGEVISNEVNVIVSMSDKPKEYKAGNKWALLIANGKYGKNSLFTPISDAQKIAESLEKCGFNCLILINLNYQQFKNTVHSFSEFIDKEDYVVFYYAGHGFNLGGDLIVPIDAFGSDISKFTNELISPIWIRNIIQKKSPSLYFMILDMCRTKSVPCQKLYLNHLKLIPQAQRNSITLFATTEGYASLEEPSCSSILSKHLIEQLETPKDIQTLARKVLEGIQYEESDVTNNQVPILHCDIPDTRSLNDPIVTSNTVALDKWNLLLSVGGIHSIEHKVESTLVKIKSWCTIKDNIANIIEINSEIRIIGKDVDSTNLLLNVQTYEVQELGYKRIFTIEDAQKVQCPIILTVQMLDVSGKRIDNDIILNYGFPSILKAKIWSNNLSENF